MRKLIVACMVTLLLPMYAEAQDGRRLDTMTICVATGVKEVTVRGISTHFFDDELELLLRQSEGEQSHKISLGSEGLLVDGKSIDATRLRIRSSQNWLDYGGRVFREDLIVLPMLDDPGRLALINEIKLEHYLYGLINKEALASWPLDAKKAQAVAARTYALYRKMYAPRPVCDMGSSELDQVYGGYLAEDAAARLAVDQTRGEVLTYQNKFAKTFYSSTCGGKTASSRSIWQDDQPYLVSKSCPYCSHSPAHRWTYEISKTSLGKKLGVPRKYLKSYIFDIPERDESGRVKQLRLRYGGKKQILTGEQFRKKIGYNKLKGTQFSFSIRSGKVKFTGKGLGHGVGMCQWGAAGQAGKDRNYREILGFYYTGTKIRKVY